MTYYLPGMPRVPKATAADLDSRIQLWHSREDRSATIQDYLGWSDEEYLKYVYEGMMP